MGRLLTLTAFGESLSSPSRASTFTPHTPSPASCSASHSNSHTETDDEYEYEDLPVLIPSFQYTLPRDAIVTPPWEDERVRTMLERIRDGLDEGDYDEYEVEDELTHGRERGGGLVSRGDGGWSGGSTGAVNGINGHRPGLKSGTYTSHNGLPHQPHLPRVNILVDIDNSPSTILDSDPPESLGTLGSIINRSDTPRSSTSRTAGSIGDIVNGHNRTNNINNSSMRVNGHSPRMPRGTLVEIGEARPPSGTQLVRPIPQRVPFPLPPRPHDRSSTVNSTPLGVVRRWAGPVRSLPPRRMNPPPRGPPPTATIPVALPALRGLPPDLPSEINYVTLTTFLRCGGLVRVHDANARARLTWTGSSATSGFATPPFASLSPKAYMNGTKSWASGGFFGPYVSQSLIAHLEGRGGPDPPMWISASSSLPWVIWSVARALRRGVARVQVAIITPRDELRWRPNIALKHAAGVERYDTAVSASQSGEVVFYGRIFAESVQANMDWTVDSIPFTLPKTFWRQTSGTWLDNLVFGPSDDWAVSLGKMNANRGIEWHDQPVHAKAYPWPHGIEDPLISMDEMTSGGASLAVSDVTPLGAPLL